MIWGSLLGKKTESTSNKQQGKRNEKKPMILFFDNHVIVRICSSCSPVVLFLFVENAWKCVNVVKSNQFTNQTNPENQENALCNLPCGAMPPHFNEFQFHCTCATVGLDICGIKRWYHDIMPAACSRDQFYLKNRSDRTMLVLCWYPPSNAFKQSTWASAPFVDQDLLIIQGAVDFFVCWVLRSLCLPFFWGAVWIYVYVFHLCWGIHVATI